MIKRIIETIKSRRAVKRQLVELNSDVARKCEELKKQLMADVVEPTACPIIYKVTFLPISDNDSTKYNMYNVETDSYVFQDCKTFIECLTEDICIIRGYDTFLGFRAGLYDFSTNNYILTSKLLMIRQHTGDRVLLQTETEIVLVDLKTKKKKRTIKI